VEGLLRVLRPGPDGGEIEVDRMGPGSAFGEFSLLTGAPRTATVVPHGDAIVYEITKDDLAPILQGHPELAERLSWILAQRQMRRRAERSRTGRIETRPAAASNLWLKRVRKFFGLGDDTGTA
jgi:CRP-like cAMP-binding protein